MNKINTLIEWDKVFSGDVAQLDFVFSGLLAGTVGGIIAPGNTGKSFLGLSLCCSLVAKNILGLDVNPGNHKVTYITAEDPKIILEHRLLHLVKLLNKDEHNQIKKYMTVQSIHGTSPKIIDSRGERDENWINGLKRAAVGQRLMIIDTLRKFHQGEENDSGHMTLLTQVLDEIASESGCAILFLHHANKMATLSGQGDNQGASRGSSALSDNIRFQLNIVGMTEKEAEERGVDETCRSKFIKLIGTKNNYAESQDDHWLRRVDGGVLIEAHLESPARAEAAKEKKKKFEQKSKQKEIIVDTSDPESLKGLSHKDVFG